MKKRKKRKKRDQGKREKRNKNEWGTATEATWGHVRRDDTSSLLVITRMMS